MKLYEQPVEGYESKFVITENEAFFVPFLNRVEAPRFVEIMQEIFDLDDPQVFADVDGRLFGGRIILGHYDPSTKEVVIQVPLGTSDYVEQRIKEVFGNDV